MQILIVLRKKSAAVHHSLTLHAGFELRSCSHAFPGHGFEGGMTHLARLKKLHEEVEMKTRSFLCLVLACVLAAAVMSIGAATAQDNSHKNPASKGVPVKSIVELGSVASSNYDVTVTLLETVRGKEAMQRLQAASPDNKPPQAGFEYVLARVRFELLGRSASDTRPFDLAMSPFQWVAYASDFRQYDGPSAVPPKPDLKRIIRPGETAEGWLVLAVEQKETKPVLTFDPASGGATGRGNTLFFKLY
jgi:hypothetical protein